MKLSTLKGALPIVARSIGKLLSVKIVMKGNGASTNGTVIKLPELPLKCADVAVLAFGYLIHEAAHIRLTDFTVWNSIESDLVRNMTNVIEDNFIEKNVVTAFPGAKKRLAQLSERLVKDGNYIAADESLHPAKKLQRYVSHRLRYEFLGQLALEDIAAQSERVFKESVPKGFAVRLDALLGTMGEVKSTKDSLFLSQQILRILEDELEDKDEDKGGESPPKDGKNDSGNEGQNQGNSPDDSKNESGGDNQGQGKSSDGSPSESKGDNADQSDPLKENLKKIMNAKPEDFDGDIMKKVAEQLGNEAAKAVKEQGGSMGAGYGYCDDPPLELGDPSLLLDESRAQTNALRTRLRRLMETQRQRRKSTCRRGKRINSKKLFRLAVGDDRVYMRNQAQTGVDTSVVILTDSSGSMNGSVMSIARQSTLSVSLALEEIAGVRTSVGTFPGYQRPIQPVVSFDDSVKRNAARFTGIRASGGTPIVEALWWALEQLEAEGSTRKMILMITDCRLGNNEVVISKLKQLVAIGAASGVEVLGLQILKSGTKDTSMNTIFSRFDSIQNAEELPNVMFGMLQDALKAVA